MAYLNTTSATGNRFAAVAASLFETMVTRYKQRRLYRETFDGLSALNNRELEDLGLSRGDLRRVARESALNADV